MAQLLQQFQHTTMDTYYYTYPDGLAFGYQYNQSLLQYFYQDNLTYFTFNCDSNGAPYYPPVAIDYTPGDGTVSNPGNNNTLQNAPGGNSGKGINYFNDSYESFSSVYAQAGILYKSYYAIAVNGVTKEKVVFVNDWTISFLSGQLKSVVDSIPFPMFAGIVEIDTGSVVGTSSNANILSADGSDILELNQINDPFMSDFAQYINDTFQPKGNLTQQLSVIAHTTQTLHCNRKFDGKNWRLELKYFLLAVSLTFCGLSRRRHSGI
ncbi:hypothetical protein BCR33DRAFT_309156 [Rhizoclosmatium globosum]|uniref:Uncharacterized protein n=1 Tax=Rhizoclosmatium globosum TaxID=329046 RepID=A0A1Y2C5R3_9FUNG|nr:hypothetical protein BCR33DRAFT_309156 [Rhizoclosmatium globosum]|eukprot:ORY42382.1 hypothetical protein BCR33DRAFT_309156 [Rhizoclosmatium globosum]